MISVKIYEYEPPVDVDCEVRNEFAVGLTPAGMSGEKFVVLHVPSSLKVTTFKNKKRAWEYVEAVRTLGDWNKPALELSYDHLTRYAGRLAKSMETSNRPALELLTELRETLPPTSFDDTLELLKCLN